MTESNGKSPTRPRPVEVPNEARGAAVSLPPDDRRVLALQLRWGELFRLLPARSGGPPRALEVHCGAGEFPAALRRHGGVSGLPAVEYALHDPDGFAVRQAKARLAPPFVPGEEYASPARELGPPGEPYDLVLSALGLRRLPADELPAALSRMLAAADPGGLTFVALDSRRSHLPRLRELGSRRLGCPGDPGCVGEDVLAALAAGPHSPPVARWSVEYEARFPLADAAGAESYLRQGLGDDGLTLDAMLADGELGPYLRWCRDEGEGAWRFRHNLGLIFAGEPSLLAALESLRELR